MDTISLSSGQMKKSNPRSIIRVMHRSSDLAKITFGDSPHSYFDSVKFKCVVLQVMILPAEWMLVEVIKEDDFFETL